LHEREEDELDVKQVPRGGEVSKGKKIEQRKKKKKKAHKVSCMRGKRMNLT
jgi:hypothetical protein